MCNFKKIIFCALLFLPLLFLRNSAVDCNLNDIDTTKYTDKNEKIVSEQTQTSPQKTTKDEMEREIRLENARYEYELSKIQSDYSLNTFKYKNIISSYVYLVTHTESELSSEIRSINQQISELKGKIKSSSNSLEPLSSIQRGTNMDYQ